MKIKDIISSYINEVFHNLSKEKLNTEVSYITDNSEQVIDGSIFVAIEGNNFNGVDYISQAFLKGAVAVVIPSTYKEKIKVKDDNIIFTNNTRDFFSRSNFYLHSDSIPTNIFSISGTNGKSSVTFFLSQFLYNLNISNIIIGTLGVYVNGKKEFECLTTPDSNVLVKCFEKAKRDNIEHVILESSSQGIDQRRIDGLSFKSIGFTNLTKDHIDYHKNMENYFLAKTRLYTDFNHNGAVINTDNQWGEKLLDICKKKKIKAIDYGFNAKDLKILKIEKERLAQKVTILYKNQQYTVNINLIGEIQVYNILCSIGMLLTSGFDIESLLLITPKIQSVPGRLNLISENNIKKAKIFLDFAHTPNALEEVLKTLRKENPNKLHVVFGCGGNRDKGKRTMMGEIASKYADYIYITDDNPRFESADKIREEISKGIINDNNKEVYNIGDRGLAIKKAISGLSEGDILIIAGKSYKNYQEIKGIKKYFSDSEAVEESLTML